ncbi:MAG: hypothetical protein COA83_09615 [Methylophaga sp.]|nr:MAG: hypothetical protein COA83_09615 [Methylophaga sp.]
MSNIYIKKPVKIEAIKWTGDNVEEIQDFVNDGSSGLDFNGNMAIQTLEGGHIATTGDMIIKGVHGEHYPCKPDIFEKTYYTQEEYAQLDL